MKYLIALVLVGCGSGFSSTTPGGPDGAAGAVSTGGASSAPAGSGGSFGGATGGAQPVSNGGTSSGGQSTGSGGAGRDAGDSGPVDAGTVHGTGGTTGGTGGVQTGGASGLPVCQHVPTFDSLCAPRFLFGSNQTCSSPDPACTQRGLSFCCPASSYGSPAGTGGAPCAQPGSPCTFGCCPGEVCLLNGLCEPCFPVGTSCGYQAQFCCSQHCSTDGICIP